MVNLSTFVASLSLAIFVNACDDCTAEKREIVQTRLVRRMQPDALNATSTSKGPLEWGQINFLQTTDTHGWLEGHLKEPNYGADWGDFVSFTKAMRQKADNLGVDLLLVDTGVSLRSVTTSRMLGANLNRIFMMVLV
jgi:2',3'-cyclic-nucleotide 2'-phosphodiesterase (5'-nucleotidase family)